MCITPDDPVVCCMNGIDVNCGETWNGFVETLPPGVYPTALLKALGGVTNDCCPNMRPDWTGLVAWARASNDGDAVF